MSQSPFHEAHEIIQAQYFDAAHRARHAAVVIGEIPAVGQPPPSHRLVREPLVRGAIDEACMEFAKTKRLPMMNAETAVFFWDRFDQGYELCGWALRNNVQFPTKTTYDLLKLFLVEFWFYSGHLRWSTGKRGVLF